MRARRVKRKKQVFIKVNGELTIYCSQLVKTREPNIDKNNYKTISGYRFTMDYFQASGLLRSTDRRSVVYS